jgi:hypothetical protein
LPGSILDLSGASQSDFVDEESEDEDEELEDDEVVLVLDAPSLAAPESEDFDSPSEDDDDEVVRPFAEAVEDRESVIYQPLPLNTMPTGWMTLRSAPPHCSQVVRGGSEKLWRFSMRSLQAVQV